MLAVRDFILDLQFNLGPNHILSTLLDDMNVLVRDEHAS